PILDLLPELLSQVFIRCFPMDDFVVPSASSAPLLLTQICSMWREVAIHTPGLWCSIFLSISDSTKDMVNLRTALMRTWIDRSGQCPLSV
ncbi:hypothetical protein NEOLEDRAFT_1027987, partial [Neolentinus lepideus HHB14362 ss-1]